ncbi:activator-dependent family glycosyltransferase [Streptomyces sp. ST2-7A]|uniref:activator-dependent family glycosyltransferase n=1 Tax=Streptomyces sp. ST2-7A TaxID=2907214 RepID=UPI001F432A48|nr:activator-dependent family glycosyltransferase [Streptomyces sp. ST2-7A]MCE7080552.1 activator-dependent family glycosyltransferase [Streptomyces sp. ST2-7A]
MRALFTTLAKESHLHNLVPLASALRTAGHEVVVASQPELAASISRSGLTAVPVGKPLHIQRLARRTPRSAMLNGGTAMINETRPERLTPEYVHDLLRTSASFYEVMADRVMTDDLVDFARSWQPDLVVWDAMTYSGPVAAQAVGAAHARILFGLDHWGRIREIFHRQAADPTGPRLPDPLRHWLSGKLAPYGTGFDEETVTGQLTIDPMPPWMRYPVNLPTLPLRHIPYNGPAVIPNWLRHPPTRPRVCLTLGISLRGMLDGRMSLTDLLDAVADMEVEVVATLDAEQLAEVRVPPNVRAVDFVPLNALLPSCSAVVHHGGGMTRGNAMALGIPQLIVPNWLWDEEEFARRLADRGAALMLTTEELTPERLRKDLERLLEDPSFGEAAARVRRDVNSVPCPNAVVPTLEDFVSRHGRGATENRRPR